MTMIIEREREREGGERERETWDKDGKILADG